MAVEYVFQRVGNDPETGKAYESETIYLPAERATAFLKKWKVAEEPKSKKKRPSDASTATPAPAAQKAKVEKKQKQTKITTFGPEYRRAVNDLFARLHGPRPEHSKSGVQLHEGLVTEGTVKEWNKAILPLVQNVKEEKERKLAARYAIYASHDIYGALELSLSEEEEQDELNYFRKNATIVDPLRKAAKLHQGQVQEWEERLLESMDGLDAYNWSWRFDIAEGKKEDDGDGSDLDEE